MLFYCDSLHLVLRLPVTTLDILGMATNMDLLWVYSWILFFATIIVLLTFSTSVLLNGMLIFRPTILDDVNETHFILWYTAFIGSTSALVAATSYYAGHRPQVYVELFPSSHPNQKAIGLIILAVTALFNLCFMLAARCTRAIREEGEKGLISTFVVFVNCCLVITLFLMEISQIPVIFVVVYRHLLIFLGTLVIVLSKEELRKFVKRELKFLSQSFRHVLCRSCPAQFICQRYSPSPKVSPIMELNV